jgi:hypothetical protein
MQVYSYVYNCGVRASIIRKLPLGCLIDNVAQLRWAKKNLISPIDALNSQQLVGKVMAYQGDDVKVKDESLNTRSGE